MKNLLKIVFVIYIFINTIDSFGQFQNSQTSHRLTPQSENINSSVLSVPDALTYWNGRAFGYNAYSSTIITGPFKFFLNNPSLLTVLSADPLSSNFVSAGSFDGSGNWWGVRYGSLNLVKIDTVTGVITNHAIVTGATSITGLTYDPITNYMYALDYASVSKLGIINLTNGVFTPIGSSVPGIIIDIACSNTGQIYGINITDDNLYSINKNTGAGTIIGSLGVNANYSQGMSWDRSVDSCYWASYTGSGQLRRLNIQTGASTVIGNFDCEVDALAIPGFHVPQIIHSPLPNTQNLSGPYTMNCQIYAHTGSTITYAKLFWSRNNNVITDSLNLTLGQGNNYTGNIPGNGQPAVYRYYIKAIDNTGKVGISPNGAPFNVYSFQAIAEDTTKPNIIHTPITECYKNDWPATVNAVVTDPLGIDSVWVVWRKNYSGQNSRFNLSKISGDNWSGVFNSDSSQVFYGDSIYYKILARDASIQQNVDSTSEYAFIISYVQFITIGTDTIHVGWPFYTFYMDSRTDILLLSSEMKIYSGLRYLLSIGFHVKSNMLQVMQGFKIKMQNTTINSITSFTGSGWTTVYDGTYFVPDTGWQYINLQYPFVYEGNKNLLIEICYNNSTYTGNSYVYASETTGKNVHQHSDLTSGDGCYDIATPGNTYTQRPNIRIFCPPGIIINTGQKENTIPDDYSLSQNFPNPFNPTTKINFAIPKQGMVTLKVYDVLGREVANLVNEVKTAGNYIVDFDASALSSGVYFYKLDVNGFSDVKRMILIR
jgi:hypothetical protein